ncbi:helicase [Parashewanella curva]|uniref:Helicase n=1 Tax=Parashewanella curva TaxID=2338552 RepID=A0A3L8Q184_9GAMM|nr:DEAD/DEAH box helicase [Parashewanella curva]RLV61396.1 helicase [Parashewanella curva]
MSNRAIYLNQISNSEIKPLFNQLTFIRGLQYFKEGRVIDIEISDDLLTANARVKGSMGQTYKLVFGLFEKHAKKFLFSDCSCPVGQSCKHVAASLLHIVHNGTEALTPIQGWFDQLEEQDSSIEEIGKPNNKEELLYILRPRNGEWLVEFRKGKLNKFGQFGKGRFKQVDEPRFVSTWEFSQDEIRLFQLLAHEEEYDYEYKIKGEAGAFALKKMVETGRCFLGDDRWPFKLDSKQELEYHWIDHGKKGQQLELLLEGKKQWHVLPTKPAYYLDEKTLQIGIIDTNVSAEKLQLFKQAPVMSEAELEKFSTYFFKHFPANALPKTLLLDFQDIVEPLVTKLTLTMWQDEISQSLQPIVKAEFTYGDYSIAAAGIRDEFSVIKHSGTTIKINRDNESEVNAISLLFELGLSDISPEITAWQVNGSGIADTQQAMSLWTQGSLPDAIVEWVEFVNTGINECQKAGFVIEFADDFDLNIVEPEVIVDIDDEEESGWFSMSLTADINGQQIELLPLIAAWLGQNHEPSDEEELLLPSPHGGFIKIKVSSIRPIINIIEELFSGRGDKLKIPDNRAMLLNELSAHEISLINGQRVKALAEKLANFKGIEAVSIPESMNATLREYQHEGLNWLCFLKEYGFGGILADDMGLGKTLQTLAFIAKQQELGLNQKGSLIICPTSLVGNWHKELQKFTPKLNVAVSHGVKRKPILNRLSEYDVVITTYPLINRDIEHFENETFDHIVLDEAQQIKNVKAKSTQQIKELKASFKLCLSGTPLENHLGELKSLMDFSLVGLLGNHLQFKKYFRQPIEKEGNVARAQELVQRVSPFLLRRTKDQVMADLPAKTVIEQDIILEKDQRNLYESIRVAMEQRIRELFAQKGVANSHIEFLDALLKLRQACCDARLVKLKQAQNVKNNGKLDWLKKNVPEMVKEGRKILIFSQFTTMLTLIEEELYCLGIKYSKLTGQTRKRQVQIDNFQEGENTVFLISLKAGGTGLNLTAADTVIHYDPWWNPAVEKQATDRSHRIGQDKAVFVYKLIAEGTIEEKIQELQKHKQDIADSVLSGKKQSAWSGNADELLSLFSR